jgi:hypothetical protein
VVVVVVELDDSGTGGGVTIVVDVDDGGTSSTTGAGVSSTCLWYEKHPDAIAHAAITAGTVTIRCISRTFLSSIELIPVKEQERGHHGRKEFPKDLARKADAFARISFRGRGLNL